MEQWLRRLDETLKRPAVRRKCPHETKMKRSLLDEMAKILGVKMKNLCEMKRQPYGCEGPECPR